MKRQWDQSNDNDLDVLRNAALQSLYSRKYRQFSSYSNLDSLDRNDKDYRFEFSSKDIDERFPQEDADDFLIKHSNDRDERQHQHATKTPSISVTVKLPTIDNDFDLRQLIKKHRTDQISTKTNRIIELLSENQQKKYIKSK